MYCFKKYSTVRLKHCQLEYISFKNNELKNSSLTVPFLGYNKLNNYVRCNRCIVVAACFLRCLL